MTRRRQTTLLVSVSLVFVSLTPAASGVSAQVQAAPPSNTSPPTISGTAREGQTLTGDPGTWSSSQPLSFAYQWQRCDSSGNGCASVVGATAQTHLLSSADVGSTMRVRVTATSSKQS